MDLKNLFYRNSVKDCKNIIMRAIEAHEGEQAFCAALMEL